MGHPSAVVRGKAPKQRPGKQETDVSDGGRMAPGGYSNVRVVAVDENGEEITR